MILLSRMWDVRNLLYDLGLETHGVFESWSVAKGLPFKKGEARLAKPAADHLEEHFNFEGP